MKNLFKFIVMTGIVLMVPYLCTYAQVSINADNSLPDASAMLEVKSTTKGALLPRMTQAEISAISNPANGLQVFCTTDSKMYIFVSTVNLWKEVAYGSGTIVPACGSQITDNRDGKIYNILQIGTQCWFKQNLNTGIRIDGLQEQTNNGIIEKYCYSDAEANCAVYGGLYQWNEMMNYSTTPGVQGICPSGWHIPTVDDWATVITFLGGQYVAGGKMKSTGTIGEGTGLWFDPNTGATNESGFTALPAGLRYNSGNFNYMGDYSNFWSSSEDNTTLAWYQYLYYNYSSVTKDNYDKDAGHSVRCLRDF